MNIYTHNRIKSEYERRQKAAVDDAAARREEIYGKIPRIRDIDAEIRFSGIRCNRLILSGALPADKVLEELTAGMEALKSEKLALLLTAGYPPDYFETTYQCLKCKDTGWIATNTAVLEKCACYKQQLIGILYSQANLKLTETENFSAFHENYYPEEINESKYGIKKSPRENILGIREKCQRFIENFDRLEEKNLFFCGPTGVGKTFMANCIAAEILNRGRTVLYQRAPALFEAIGGYKQRAFREEDETEDIGYRNIFDVELLIIDDLGTESQTAARYAELLNILNTRHANNLTRPCKTIISTNLEAEKLYEHYTERVASRIIGSFALFRFAGEDIRTMKKGLNRG